MDKEMQIENLHDIFGGEFNIIKVIKADPLEKILAFLISSTKSEEQGILKLVKSDFDINSIDQIISTFTLNPTFQNDIFKKFTSTIKDEILIETIYPATQKLISKYSTENMVLVRESEEIYREVTEKYINTTGVQDLGWVDNILAGRAEIENVYCQSQEFIIAKDYKFNERNILDLHLLAIVRDGAIRSIRDIHEQHLPLLRGIYKSGEKYGITEKYIRSFVHYYPTFFHFHVHFTHVNAANNSLLINKALPLIDVIQNIQLLKNYYQKITIQALINQDSELYQRICSYKTNNL